MKRGILAWTLAIITLLALASTAAAYGPGMDDHMPYGNPGTGGGNPPVSDATGPGNGPGPHMDDADHLYCPQTGHYLSYGFKSFWQQNGGVDVFGYPMTGEMNQQGHTVQYLERQRFEYHPEYAGTPYAVELGLLGSEQAQHLNLMHSAPFTPLPAGTTGNANSTYFPQTGHSVSNGFRDYWMSHGLNLGDPGISMRESLALFGYPISQEFTDPATGYTVQYFQRAVFEYHPNNPTQYQVLLRRLGADMLGDN